jgi:hypothetical protein
MKTSVKSHKRKGKNKVSIVRRHMRSLGPWDLNEDASNRHRKRILKKIDPKMESRESEVTGSDDLPSDYKVPKPGVKKDLYNLQEGKIPKDENQGKVAVPYHEVVNGMRVQRIKYVDSKTLAPNELKKLKMLKINQNRKIK